MNQGVCLKVYVHELQKHHGISLFEWLLEKGKELGLEGGSAIRSIAGFGRHGHMHAEHFFELGSNVPVEVTFILKKEKLEGFLVVLEEEGLDLFYSVFDIHFGSSKKNPS